MKKFFRILATTTLLAAMTCTAPIASYQANAQTVYAIADGVIGRTEYSGGADSGVRLKAGKAYECTKKVGSKYLINGYWFWGGDGYISTKKPTKAQLEQHQKDIQTKEYTEYKQQKKKLKKKGVKEENIPVYIEGDFLDVCDYAEAGGDLYNH